MKQKEQNNHVEIVKLAKYSLRRRFKKWHVVFTLNGKLYERSTGERCERKARKRAKEIYDEIMKSKEPEEKTMYKMETPHGVVFYVAERNYGKHVANMKEMLCENGQEIYDLLKEIHEVFEAECCIPCSKCHELQGKVEAILEKCRVRD